MERQIKYAGGMAIQACCVKFKIHLMKVAYDALTARLAFK